MRARTAQGPRRYSSLSVSMAGSCVGLRAETKLGQREWTEEEEGVGEETDLNLKRMRKRT